jgi:hypothetical protein
MGERWNEKLLAFRNRLAQFGLEHPPRLVTPKRVSLNTWVEPLRISGPTPALPPHWHEPEGQNDLPPAA